MKATIILFIFCFSYFFISAQSTAKSNARITAVRGGHIDFIFNSFDKYNSGITLSNYTQFDITYNNTSDPLNTWKISAKALTADINGEGIDKLDLDVIELTAIPVGVGDGTSLGTFFLSAVSQDLLNAGVQGSNRLVNITYECGTGAKKMLGKKSGFYTVDIEFTLGE